MTIDEVLATPEGREWFESRPRAVQAMVRHRPPGMYRLRSTNEIVEMYAYGEDEDGGCTTCTVRIHPQLNPARGLAPNVIKEVFGIAFDDLLPLEA